MTRPGRLLSWLLSAVILAGSSACTSDDMKPLTQEHDNQIGPTGNLVAHQNGTAVDLRDSPDAKEISLAVTRLIGSCGAQLKMRVSGGDWQAARRAPFSVELRSDGNTAIALENGVNFDMQAAIITINEESPTHTSVLTLVDNQYRSPFVHCSSEHTIALKDLVNYAMHVR